MMHHFKSIDDILKPEHNNTREAFGTCNDTGKSIYITSDIVKAAYLATKATRFQYVKKPQLSRNRYKLYFVFFDDQELRTRLDSWQDEANDVKFLLENLECLKQEVKEESKLRGNHV